MARDRNDLRSDDMQGDAQRSGLGDGQGTRVGRPAPAPEPGEYPGVSDPEPTGRESDRPTRSTEERMAGNSGSSDKSTSSKSQNKRTGAGSEAAEGMHAAQGPARDEHDNSSLETSHAAQDAKAGEDKPGSEPLEKRDREVKHNYGGEGGAPRQPPDGPA